MSPTNNVLFRSDLWEPALEKYAQATNLTVTLFDADQRIALGTIHPTPLFQLFKDQGYDPGIFDQCARQCLDQREKRPTTMVSHVGLTTIGTSLALEGKIVGAAVAGYAFVDFSQASEIQRLARDSGIGFEHIWRVTREQKPVPRGRLIVQGELLQILGDALLKANLQTRRSEQYAENLEGVVRERTASLRELSSNLLKAQDDERRKVARELHDSIGQNLVHAKMSLVALKRQNALEAETPAYLDLTDTLDGCVKELRTISYLLHPPLLDEVGFSSAAQWYAEGFAERSGISINLDLPRMERLPSGVELVLFRVLQESLTNVHRHSRSSSVDVRLRLSSEEAILEVIDHGKGMSSESIKQFKQNGESGGVGLSSMRERVSEVGGKFDIQSDEDGTVIRASIPLKDAIKRRAAAGNSTRP